MDTLLEANKHASLMRRRDQPRQFSAAQLQCNSAISPRSFRSVAPAAPRQALRGMPPTSVPANARMVTNGRFVTPPAPGSLRGRFQAQPRPAPRPRRASFRPPVLLPIREAGPKPVGLSRAGAAAIRFHRNMGEGARRSFLMLARTSRRAILSARAFRALDVTPMGISGRRPRGLKSAAKEGNAFRVSVSMGFRLPAMRQPIAAQPGPAARGLTWPVSLPLAGVACIGQAVGPYAAELDFPIPAARAPVDRKVRLAAGLQVARAIPVADRTPYGNRMETRSADWVCRASEKHPVIRKSGLRAGQPSVAPGCIALKPVPAKAATLHRVVRAPFEPRDQAMINISYSWNASR